jgi:hypothetical protein
MQPVLLGSAHRFAIFRQPPCFTGRGAGEGRLRATSGPSHGQAEGQSVTLCGHLQPNDGSTVDLSCSIRSFRDDTKFHQMCCARLAWCRFAAQRGIRPDFASRWG